MFSTSFNKTRRLIKAADYQYIFNKASRSSDKYFTILARKGLTNNSRLGLAISKKAVRLAVQRNRIKRLTREYFRLDAHKSISIDFVVMAKKGTDKMPNQILVESLKRNFSRLYRKL